MNAAVVCPQPAVADIAAEILRQGGNAVDAVVAAMAAQGVVDPLMCGLGGYGVMTVHRAATGETVVLDFFARAPFAVEEGSSGDTLLREFSYDYGFIVEGGHNEIGHRSVATPGTVAGMAKALELYGSMPWSAVLEPAAALAENGFDVNEAQRIRGTHTKGPTSPAVWNEWPIPTMAAPSTPTGAIHSPSVIVSATGSGRHPAPSHAVRRRRLLPWRARRSDGRRS